MDDRSQHPQFMDALGKLCADGKDAAMYLWQVPADTEARQRIVAILEQAAARTTATTTRANEELRCFMMSPFIFFQRSIASGGFRLSSRRRSG